MSYQALFCGFQGSLLGCSLSQSSFFAQQDVLCALIWLKHQHNLVDPANAASIVLFWLKRSVSFFEIFAGLHYFMGPRRA